MTSRGELGSSAPPAALGRLALVGFGAYWADDDTSTTAAAGPASVAIADFAFSPPSLNVAPGTTVTWTNNDSFEHSIVVEDGSFTSASLAGGATAEFTFDTPGQHAYVCGIHPSMSGIVSVTD